MFLYVIGYVVVIQHVAQSSFNAFISAFCEYDYKYWDGTNKTTVIKPGEEPMGMCSHGYTLQLDNGTAVESIKCSGTCKKQRPYVYKFRTV